MSTKKAHFDKAEYISKWNAWLSEAYLLGISFDTLEQTSKFEAAMEQMKSLIETAADCVEMKRKALAASRNEME